MKVTITQADIKIEYEDDRQEASMVMGGYTYEQSVTRVLESLGQLVKLITDAKLVKEEEKEDGEA
jgi:hypothetical protein